MKKIQGDLSFVPFKGEITGERVEHNGSVVLALGEHTGHKHVITVPDITKMDAYKTADGGWLLTLKEEGRVIHEQHGAITLPAGTYQVTYEREHDFFKDVSKKVLD